MARLGRPNAENPKKIRFSIRLDNTTNQRLESYCSKNSLTKGEVIRRAIELYFDKELEIYYGKKD